MKTWVGKMRQASISMVRTHITADCMEFLIEAEKLGNGYHAGFYFARVKDDTVLISIPHPDNNTRLRERNVFFTISKRLFLEDLATYPTSGKTFGTFLLHEILPYAIRILWLVTDTTEEARQLVMA